MPDFTLQQLQQICQLVRACGQQSRQMATEQFQVYEKGRDDYVTSVDRALDQQLTTGFTALFPDNRVITEENAQSWSAFATDQRRLWLVDPVDGTDDFIQGKPHYAVMVGLLDNYQPTAGWIYAPAFDHLYYGGPDWGLLQEYQHEPFEGRSAQSADQPANPSDYTPMPLVPTRPQSPSSGFCPVLIGYKDQKRYGQAIREFIPEITFNSIGSFGLKVLQVVCGQAGLYVYLNGRVKLWDTVGPIALAKAAGLVCCDLEGQPLRFTPDAVDAKTLTNRQTIVIGWPEYVEALRSRLQKAVMVVNA